MVEAKLTEPDIYGQRHPLETKELIEYKLTELETELAKITDKPGYDQAVEKCPSLLDRDFKLMFLRCEVFNADLAAQRLVRYWDKRISIFGPDKAFLPMTQSGGLKDDEVAFSLGIVQLTGTKDPSGRAVIFFDPSKQDKSKYEMESFARCVWYVLHAALEDVETQQHGIVFMIYPKETKFSQFDKSVAGTVMEGIKGSIPVRVSSFHICYPPTFFSLIFPFIKFFMGDRLRKRVRVHSGGKSITKKLDPFGLTKDVVPVQVGGTIQLDHMKWWNDRKKAGK